MAVFREGVRSDVRIALKMSAPCNAYELSKVLAEYYEIHRTFSRIVGGVVINADDRNLVYTATFVESNDFDIETDELEAELKRILSAAHPFISGVSDLAVTMWSMEQMEKAYGPKACPNCGRTMKIRNGKRGYFWGCTGYPKCTRAKNIAER